MVLASWKVGFSIARDGEAFKYIVPISCLPGHRYLVRGLTVAVRSTTAAATTTATSPLSVKLTTQAPLQPYTKIALVSQSGTFDCSTVAYSFLCIQERTDSHSSGFHPSNESTVMGVTGRFDGSSNEVHEQRVSDFCVQHQGYL